VPDDHEKSDLGAGGIDLARNLAFLGFLPFRSRDRSMVGIVLSAAMERLAGLCRERSLRLYRAGRAPQRAGDTGGRPP
jgi:hypothetical protein